MMIWSVLAHRKVVRITERKEAREGKRVGVVRTRRTTKERMKEAKEELRGSH